MMVLKSSLQNKENDMNKELLGFTFRHYKGDGSYNQITCAVAFTL